MDAAASDFLRCVRPHWGRLQAVAGRYCARRDDAEDLVQETLLLRQHGGGSCAAVGSLLFSGRRSRHTSSPVSGQLICPGQSDRLASRATQRSLHANSPVSGQTILPGQSGRSARAEASLAAPSVVRDNADKDTTATTSIFMIATSF